MPQYDDVFHECNSEDMIIYTNDSSNININSNLNNNNFLDSCFYLNNTAVYVSISC